MTKKADAELRAFFAAATDDGRTPRETRFFFYGGEFIALAAAAGRAGYQASFTHIADPEEFGVKLIITTAVDEQTFTPLVKQMYAWQKEFGWTMTAGSAILGLRIGISPTGSSAKSFVAVPL
jgi:hypothetical protein